MVLNSAEDRYADSKTTLWLRRKSSMLPEVALQWEIIGNEAILEKSLVVVVTRPSFAFRNQMRTFWGQENEGQGKSYVFKTVLVIPNLVMKVYSIQLHLQKELWHVLEIAIRNWGCWRATSWFRSLQWQVKMQFYFIVKYHKVDRKFKNSNSPWPRGGCGSRPPFHLSALWPLFSFMRFFSQKVIALWGRNNRNH